MTPDTIATTRTAFADDPEAQVYALAALTWMDGADHTGTPDLAHAARLLFPHSSAERAESDAQRREGGFSQSNHNEVINL